MRLQEAGVEVRGPEVGMAQDLLIEGDGGLDAIDAHVAQGTAAAIDHFVPVERPDDELGQHRVVIGRYMVAGIDGPIGTHTRTARRVIARDAPEARQEVVLGVFGVDAELDGETATLDLVLAVAQRQAGRDPDLLLDQIDTRDGLGDGVLDLDAGVHLHEVEAPVGIEQELHGPGIGIADRARGQHGQSADVLALGIVELRRGGDLDQLLIAPLDRAVALEQMDAVTMMVGQHLHLDVLGIDHALFEEHLGAPERLGCLRDDALVVVTQGGRVVATPDTAPAAARGRLEHDRIADLLGAGERLIQTVQIAGAAGSDRNARFLHRLTRGGLVAHAGDELGIRPDESDAAPCAGQRQLGVLRQETIAWMHGITAGHDGEVDDVVDVEITGERIAAQTVGLVGLLDMERVTVGLGIDGHRANAQFGTGPDDAHSDLATVGDQDLTEHK